MCKQQHSTKSVKGMCVVLRAAAKLIHICVSCRTAVVHCVMAVAELLLEMASAKVFETGYMLNISPSGQYNTSGLCNTLSETLSGIYYIFDVWECTFFFLKTEVTVYLQFKLTEIFYPASRNDMGTYKSHNNLEVQSWMVDI